MDIKGFIKFAKQIETVDPIIKESNSNILNSLNPSALSSEYT